MPAKRQPKKFPQAERVHAYARGVVAGRIVAGRHVVAACRRHLDDLKRRDLVWKPGRVQVWLDFFESLNLDAGVPFRLMEHQAFKAGCITGWHLPDGCRRFRTAYIEEGKSNGKTPFAAGFALGGLCIDLQASPEIYLAAAARHQARICFDDVDRIARATPHVSRWVKVLTNNISMPTRMGKISILSSEDKGYHGLRIHLGVLDEIHAHGSAAMVNVVEAGTKNNRNSLILLITNSGATRQGPCWAYHQRALQMLAGYEHDSPEPRRTGKPDDSLFAYVAGLDPCPACLARGATQPDPKCRHCDDWRDLRTLQKANPSLGGPFFDRDYLARRIDLAQRMPSKLNDVLQLNCCIWTESNHGWLDMASWRTRCHRPALRLGDFLGKDCYLGLDAANRIDATCMAILFSLGGGTLASGKLPIAAQEALKEAMSAATQVFGIGEKDPSGDAAKQLEAAIAKLSAMGYAVFLRTYVPQAMVDNQNQANYEAYQLWSTTGPEHDSRLGELNGPWLTVTPDAITDFARILDDLRLIASLFVVRRLQADPRELGYLLQQAILFLGEDVAVQVQQGPVMISQPMKYFEGLVAAGLIHHDGNPVLDWMLGNVEQKTTRGGGPVKYYYPVKPSAEKKIDAAPAAFMALDGALRGTAPEAEPFVVMLG